MILMLSGSNGNQEDQEAADPHVGTLDGYR